jgi:hypothetical protein
MLCVMSRPGLEATSTVVISQSENEEEGEDTQEDLAKMMGLKIAR